VAQPVYQAAAGRADRRGPARRGRPPAKGPRLPALRILADQPTTTWQQTTLRRYGKTATVHLAAVRCLWYYVHGRRAVTVVLVRDHARTRGFDLALVATDPDATAAELVERYAARWAIEVCFLEAKHLVGVGQARNRTRLAVQRTVPFGLCCHSLLVIWYAHTGQATSDVTARRARSPWYRHKRTPSTLDMLVAFRRAMLAEISHTSPAQATGTKLIDALLTWDIAAA
jgi:hypothetical protein